MFRNEEPPQTRVPKVGTLLCQRPPYSEADRRRWHRSQIDGMVIRGDDGKPSILKRTTLPGCPSC